MALPLDKSYAELSAAEKAQARSDYIAMPERDEPPFPVAGMGALLRPIADAVGAMRVRGDLTLFVTVSSTGKPVSVAVVKSPDEKLTHYAASVLMKAQYKPAVCAGKPCTMQLPLRMALDFEG